MKQLNIYLDQKYQLKFFWNISHEVSIKCAPKKIWEIISSKSNLEKYHPFCKKNQIIDWKSNKHVDEIEYLNGKVFKRNFINWIDEKGYDLLINQEGKPHSYVSWRIQSSNEHSIISIKLYPYLFNKKYKLISLFPFYFMVKPMLKTYLKSVLGGLKLHIEKNKIIKNNQFGRHLWFS